MSVKVTRTKDRRFFIITDEEGTEATRIRMLPGRRWNDGVHLAWTVPYCTESWEALVKYRMVTASNKPGDLRSIYTVHYSDAQHHFIVRMMGTPEDILKAKRIPEQRSFVQAEKAWVCKPTQANVAYLKKNFPQLVWDGKAELVAEAVSLRNRDPHPDEIATARAKREALEEALVEEITDYDFFLKPYQHQRDAFSISRHKTNFALFMEQGTGKGAIVVHTAAYHFLQGEIVGVLVVCPNAMKEPWIEEFGKHLSPEFPLDIFMWEGKTRHKAEGWIRAVAPGERKLRVMIMNFEALSGEIGGDIAKLFLSKHSCLFAVDESSKIKSPVAARTKRIIHLGKLAKLRRILSGTPVTQGPMDVFSQLKFLDGEILGFSSYYSFRNRYALLGGWQGKQVIGYQYLDELQAKVATVSYRVLKKDCLDLPPKVYEKRVVELTKEQREIYERLDQEMSADMTIFKKGGEEAAIANVTIMHVITKIMRMQQVTGGFLTLDANEELDLPQSKPMMIPGGNPKLEALMEILDEINDDQKVIIWARFRPELDLIQKTVRAAYGTDSVVEFHGGIKDAERQVGRRQFQDPTSKQRFLVGQQRAGGIGTTFTAADVMVYFSNDYSLEVRLQSEDRFHRIGQSSDRCTIIDIMAKKTWDQRFVSGFRGKKSIADIITGDPSLEWV